MLFSEHTPEEQARYELFKLFWMINHSYTVKDLVTSVLTYRTECAEEMADDPDGLDVLDNNVFADWESEHGFDGSVWPCIDEFLDSDDAILRESGFYDEHRLSLEILTKRLKRDTEP